MVPDEFGDGRRRPPAVWSMALLDTVAALLCLTGALFPPSPDTPVELDAIGFVAATAFAAALWHLGRRTPAWLFHANAVTHVVFTTVLVASAATGEGAMSGTFSYVVLAMYASVFFTRRQARGYLALVLVGSLTGIVASPELRAPVISWMPMAFSAVAAVEVLSSLRRQATAMVVTDPLTGLVNRAGFTVAARREQVVAARTGEPLTVVAVDLDDFKDVNDRLGHAAGDALLRDLAAEWRQRLRARDIVSRRGGDEFAFLLPGTGEADAQHLLDGLRASSCHGWSYGVASVEDGEDVEGALHRADARMYRQKAALEASPSSVVRTAQGRVRPPSP